MAKKKAHKPPRVEVVWVDACGYDAVHGTRGHVLDHAKLVIRETVGYLLDKDETRVVLVHDYDAPSLPDDEPEFGNVTVIPTGWILKIKGGPKAHVAKPGNEASSNEGAVSPGSESPAA